MGKSYLPSQREYPISWILTAPLGSMHQKSTFFFVKIENRHFPLNLLFYLQTIKLVVTPREALPAGLCASSVYCAVLFGVVVCIRGFFVAII